MRKRIFIITDSLSLPRKYGKEYVTYDVIYPQLLIMEYPQVEFIHIAYGGATITELFLQLKNYYALVNPDLIILQAGIVDCAPRALGKIELEIVKKFKLFRLVKPFFSILRKYRRITYTKTKEFRKKIQEIKSIFPGIQVWSIGILPGSTEYDKKVPRVSKNIDKYNEILCLETHFIDNSDFPPDGIMADHHHLSKKGHEIIFNKLAEEVSIWLSNNNTT